jgi:hypothetical protein
MVGKPYKIGEHYEYPKIVKSRDFGIPYPNGNANGI